MVRKIVLGAGAALIVAATTLAAISDDDKGAPAPYSAEMEANFAAKVAECDKGAIKDKGYCDAVREALEAERKRAR